MHAHLQCAKCTTAWLPTLREHANVGTNSSLLLLLVVLLWRRRVGEDEDVEDGDDHHDRVLDERTTRPLKRVRVVLIHAVPTAVSGRWRTRKEATR
jgi:hypothetical protein